MPKKKITIEDLAAMVQAGFHGTARKSDVDKRFDVMDKRFDAMDQRFDAMDNRFMNLASDVAYLKARVTEIGIMLDRHEEILEEHSEELKWMHKKLDEFMNLGSEKRAISYREFSKLVSRVGNLERKIAVKIK